MMYRYRTNHVLHIALTLGTCGAWLLVYVPIIVLNLIRQNTRRTRTTTRVDININRH